MTEEAPVIIYIRHIRNAGMCCSGAREVCAYHGIDWGSFIKNGIDVKEVEHIDNFLIKQVIQAAKDGR